MLDMKIKISDSNSAFNSFYSQNVLTEFLIFDIMKEFLFARTFGPISSTNCL